MKAIKALVLFMGLLIVAGLAVLGWGLSNQTAKMAQPRVATEGGKFGTVEVNLPIGARVEQTLVVGERLVLRVSGTSGERFVVLDPANGAVAGTFLIWPGPPTQ
jgi:hypothetical protein